MATASMTNALFSAMDRRGDGIITRDEFNPMAFTAIHNNPLVNRAPGAFPPAPALAPVPAPALAPAPAVAPAPSFGPTLAPAPHSVTFGGMTFSAPTGGALLPQPLQPGAAPASAAWTPAGMPAVAMGAAASSVSPAQPQSAAPAPTESAFLATPCLPGVTATAPTASMTNALFSAMDRRGDGILTRDEWNQMAYTAVHNNALVRPNKSLSASRASRQSFATSASGQSFGPVAAPPQSFGALASPGAGGPAIARTVSSTLTLSPAPSHFAGAPSFGGAALGEPAGLYARPSMVLAPGQVAHGAWC